MKITAKAPAFFISRGFCYRNQKNKTHKTITDFPHISNRTFAWQKHQTQQATLSRESHKAICGKSASPAPEGRHFLLTFFCC